MESLGRDEWPPASPLIEALLANPHGFNLFQAISLLERETPGRAARATDVARGDGAGESVRLSGHVALGFQSSDIHRVTASSAGASGDAASCSGPAAYMLSTQAMTLAGGQGPLPQPYTELLLERLAARDYAMRDFLDIFNHRFIGFLFRSKKKHAPGLNWASPHASPLASCVRAIAHLDLGDRACGDLPWLRHAGLMTAAPRSMAGLLSLLADRFGLAVRGTQFIGGWLALEPGSQMRLGAGAGLDGSRALGHRVWDQAAAIDIAFDGIGMAQLRDLLPTGRSYRSLSSMVRRYLQERLDVCLVLELADDIRLPAKVGGRGAAQLGWTSWLQRGPGGDGERPQAAQETNASREAPERARQVSPHCSAVRIGL
ncbi:MAG: type VI secretion system baseplate subunit TssG [Janthinobacterium lividum]